MFRIDKIALYFSCIFIIIVFFFNPHFVELTGTLETWFLYKGLVYYKDFAAFHFPLGRLVLLPLHLVTGWKLELDPFVGLIFGLGTIFLIYFSAKKILSEIATSISIIFFSIFFWFAGTGILFYHEILIGFLIALILYILIAFNEKKELTPKILFLLGLLIALTELSGQIASFTLTILFFYILLSINSNSKKGGIIFFAKINYLIMGILLPIILCGLYFIQNNALYEFYYYNIPYYLQYNGYKKDLLSLPFASLLAYYLPLILLFVFNFIKSRVPQKKIPFYILFLLLSLSTIPFIMFSVYHPHHLNYALPILALSAGLSYDKAMGSGRIGKIIFFSALIIFIYIFLTLILPWHTSRVTIPPTLKIANDTYPGDEMYPIVRWVKENTPKNARIIVLGDGMLYLRSDRLPSTRPGKGIPYSWEPFDKIKIELEKDPPSYWIIGDTFTSRLIKDYKKGYMMDFVNKELEVCYKLKFEYDVWKAWERTCD